VVLMSANLAVAGEPVLKAVPDRCVALHQGQICYQSIRFVWSQLDRSYDYCVIEKQTESALVCWLGGGASELKFEFGSDQSQTYQLKRNDGEVIGDVEIVVAWVYKSSRKRSTGWRLF